MQKLFRWCTHTPRNVLLTARINYTQNHSLHRAASSWGMKWGRPAYEQWGQEAGRLFCDVKGNLEISGDFRSHCTSHWKNSNLKHQIKKSAILKGGRYYGSVGLQYFHIGTDPDWVHTGRSFANPSHHLVHTAFKGELNVLLLTLKVWRGIILDILKTEKST